MDSRNILGDAMELKIGDLILVRGTSWIDRIIERVTKSEYSHVAVYVGNERVIEAQGLRTVGYQSLSFYEGKYDVYRYYSPLNEYKQRTILRFLQDHIGCEYDYLDIVALFIKYTFGFRNIPWFEHKRFICSTLARDAYEYAGCWMPLYDVAPEDLAKWPCFTKVS